jgi:hypothetical protein
VPLLRRAQVWAAPAATSTASATVRMVTGTVRCVVLPSPS